MKKELSCLELYYLTKELQELVNSKIDKIYQIDKEILLLQFYITGIGKKILTIELPSTIYLTKSKIKTPERPPGFSMFLRRYINNARLREIKQHDFERILELVFEKEKKFIMIIELFAKGNVILCDEEYNIINLLSITKTKDRTLKQKSKYIYPKTDYNVIELSEQELKELIKKSDKENVVKTLALDLNLGGLVSEEICLLAGADKNKKRLEDDEIKNIYSTIKKLLSKKIEAQVVYEKEKVKDIVPFEFESYKKYEKKAFENFNAALESVLISQHEVQEIKEQEKTQKQKLGKYEKIIKIQGTMIKELEKGMSENQKIGEAIYENYTMIDNILKELKKARKTMSWEEIKEKLKGHKHIKKIDDKTGKIVVEI